MGRARSTWEPPRNRYVLILPPYLVAVMLTGFWWLPAKTRTTSWVCASCARTWTETREEKLGITIDGGAQMWTCALASEVDPREECRHDWRRYGGAGAARLLPLQTWPAASFLDHLRPLGTAVKDLVRWDLRGAVEGAWTRGPFPTLRSEEEFRVWFAEVRAADPGR